MTKQKEYDKYIRSKQWKDKRQQVLERDKFQCRFCESTERLEIHHRHYRNFGNEELFDLVTVCKVCHDALTNEQHKHKNRKFDGIKHSVKQEKVSRYVPENSGTVTGCFPTIDAQRFTKQPDERVFPRYQRDFGETE